MVVLSGTVNPAVTVMVTAPAPQLNRMTLFFCPWAKVKALLSALSVQLAAVPLPTLIDFAWAGCDSASRMGTARRNAASLLAAVMSISLCAEPVDYAHDL